MSFVHVPDSWPRSEQYLAGFKEYTEPGQGAWHACHPEAVGEQRRYRARCGLRWCLMPVNQPVRGPEQPVSAVCQPAERGRAQARGGPGTPGHRPAARPGCGSPGATATILLQMDTVAEMGRPGGLYRIPDATSLNHASLTLTSDYYRLWYHYTMTNHTMLNQGQARDLAAALVTATSTPRTLWTAPRMRRCLPEYYAARSRFSAFVEGASFAFITRNREDIRGVMSCTPSTGTDLDPSVVRDGRNGWVA